MAETRVEWLGLLEKTSDVPIYDELDRYQNSWADNCWPTTQPR
jgi:hypothetical protein